MSRSEATRSSTEQVSDIDDWFWTGNNHKSTAKDNYMQIFDNRAIPDDWTPEQALAAYDLTGKLCELIWARYQVSIRQALDELDEHGSKRRSEQRKVWRNLGDEIPF